MAIANTQSQKKIFICATPQPTDLNEAAFAALTWVQVKGVGNLGETGTKTNIVSYDTLDDTVTQKGKGLSDAGSPEVECRRITDDAGQILMRTAAAHSSNNYAFKFLNQDGTINYSRGIVTGPTRPNGRNEDFELEVYTLGLNQLEVIDLTP